MLRVFCFGLLIRGRSSLISSSSLSCSSLRSSSLSSSSLSSSIGSISSIGGSTMKPSTMKRGMATTTSSSVDPSLLANAWSQQLLALEPDARQPPKSVIQATQRSLPLLEDASSVPFVCRYRTDVIDPLTTRQVHYLQTLLTKHASLESLRNKLLQVMDDMNTNKNTNKNQHKDTSILFAIQTSTSKTELEDLYAPFKPPSKGSILERIQSEHPELVAQVDRLWNGDPSIVVGTLKPHDAVLHLLSTKIAAEPKIASVVLKELARHCHVHIKTTTSDDPKYRNYQDFKGHLQGLKDHQVLAIRRGTSQKAMKMAYDIDGDKMEGTIKYHLYQILPKAAITNMKRDLLEEAVHDAWGRLLRRRGTSRLWTEKCKVAQERAMEVFAHNLHRALLAPPQVPSIPLLALDPGFQAGIKCAILDPNGAVLQLDTVKFLGNANKEKGMQVLGKLLTQVPTAKKDGDDDGNNDKVVVALGNGHGSQECRALIQEVSSQTRILVDIQLVNEAGASVWSVTEQAKVEFPKEPPSAIAAISIGRRLQNPLDELIKVPPKSLGLGMYQHDLSEKELDEKLHFVSVDAVATVGVDVNSCSVEILQKVPGLTKLAQKIVKARPLAQRNGLLKVAGLGPKTFENCAAFCRVVGPEPLDDTLVHPESYDLARWLLKKFAWKLSKTPKNLPPRSQWKTEWASEIKKGTEKFQVSSERVLAVIDNLVDSMTNVDPRLKESTDKTVSNAGSIKGCILLSPELADTEKLKAASPLRDIVGTVRNVRTTTGPIVNANILC
jgi:uncharacterized protein